MSDIQNLSKNLRARVEVYGQVNGIFVSTLETVTLLDELDRLIEVEKVLKDGLQVYADIGNPDDTFLEDNLERAILQRPKDKSTINLGGLYVLSVARQALKRADEIGKGK